MYSLGIDIGTGGSRAVLIDADGNTVASNSQPHEPFISEYTGWAEQAPDDWWKAASSAIRGVLSEPGIASDDIGAIGISGQMHGLVLIGKDGKPLRSSIIWCDQRTVRECEEIHKRIGKKRLIELVSNPALPNFTLPKLLWVKRHQPELWQKTKAVLLPKDYIRFRLTGEYATDVADGSGMLLLDVRARRWSYELLGELGIDKAVLPDVLESQELSGSVSGICAEETGLKAGTPVVAGAGDNAAGALGMGIAAPGDVSVTIGTSGVVFAVTDEPKIDALGRIHTLCHAIPGRWHVTGVTQSAGLSFQWLRKNFGGGEDYDQLTARAATVPPGADGLLWLPYLMGERTPHMDPDARAAFIGLTSKHERAHLVRAVLEGVAFSLRDSLEIFKSLGIPFKTVRLGGGGARSVLWRQIQADVFGCEAEVLEAEEGAAFGAAVLAGVGSGVWNDVDEALNASIRVRSKISPEAESGRILDSCYKAFRETYRHIRPVSDMLNSIEGQNASSG